VLRVAVLDHCFRAVLIIVTQLDVDHAGDGVCAIRGGGAVFQNLDAIDRSRRNGIQIDEHDINQAGIVSRRIGSDAPPINEDESGARIEATQGNARGAHRRIGAVLIVGLWNDVRVNGRKTLEKLFRRALPRFAYAFTVVNVDRVNPDFLRGRDVGTGNDDALRRGCGTGRWDQIPLRVSGYRRRGAGRGRRRGSLRWKVRHNGEKDRQQNRTL